MRCCRVIPEEFLVAAATAAKYDVNIFMERVFPAWCPFAKGILIPIGRFPEQHPLVGPGSACLLQDPACRNHFQTTSCFGFHIGFTSRDRFMSEVSPITETGSTWPDAQLSKAPKRFKLWEKHPEWPSLTLVQHKTNAQLVPDNIRLMDYLSNKPSTNSNAATASAAFFLRDGATTWWKGCRQVCCDHDRCPHE